MKCEEVKGNGIEGETSRKRGRMAVKNAADLQGLWRRYTERFVKSESDGER